MDMSDIAVRVCLRSRPLVSKEISDGCSICLHSTSNNAQVVLGKDKSFTYDYAFGPESTQEQVYQKSVSPMIDALFTGYNVTVLAYGQTGSGKTYTMGTSHTLLNDLSDKEIGIIPRAIMELFMSVQKNEDFEFVIKASFLEIYKEEIHDLLRPSVERTKDAVTIREDYNGQLKVTGLIEELVESPQEVLATLKKGSLARSTGSTAMNAHSSRSHAIFTLGILRQDKNDSNNVTYSKFHLVDLAGSEKADRTHAQGERFKEGVNINKGLLSLGNVINALCDKLNHIPYRDSKLTRLLQDSLGGNSHTLMIACVSPADYNFEETLNTLRYADRARKIKNKPVVNRDPQSLEICRLKQIIAQMKNGIMPDSSFDGQPPENVKSVLERNKLLETENKRLTSELQVAVDQTAAMCEKALLAELARDQVKESLQELNSCVSGAAEDDKNTKQAKIEIIEQLNAKICQIEENEKGEKTLLDCLPEVANGNASTNQESPKNDSMRVEHTKRQVEMQKQLQALNEALSKKEELAQKMTCNDGQLETMKVHYEHALKEMETEVRTLQMEREELSKNLRTVQTNPSNKISEQRRKRLQELEGKIAELQRKILEQNKMLKIKEQMEKKVTTLTSDIQSMKQQRVKLMKQMREDSQHFQKWRSTKEREVAKLKQQDRKRQYELVKMEKMHSKQQTVLKRKIEEAVLHNRRLKDAMSRQKAAAEERSKKQSTGLDGIKNRIEQWLSQELDVAVAKKETVHHLNNLLEDRKALSNQLADLREELKIQPPSKFSKGSSDSSTDGKSPVEDEKLKEKMDALQIEIKLRSNQIADLQQKICDSDQEEAVKKRWDNIHTMVEAKCALKCLFKQVIQAKFESFETNEKLTEMSVNHEEALKALQEVTAEMDEQAMDHQSAILALEQEHEEKVLYLLRQLPTNFDSSSVCDTSLIERIKFQDNEISRLGFLYEEYMKVAETNEQLKKELALSKVKGTNSTKLLPDLSQSSLSNTSLLNPAKKKKGMKKTSGSLVPREEELNFTDDELSETEMSKRDPDWIPSHEQAETKLIINKMPKKNCKCSSSSCKGCVCRKNGNNCTEACKCDPNICLNHILNQTEENRDASTVFKRSNSIISSTSSREGSLNSTSSRHSADNLNVTFDKSKTEEPSGKKIFRSISGSEMNTKGVKKMRKLGSKSSMSKLKENSVNESGLLHIKPNFSTRKESTFFDPPS